MKLPVRPGIYLPKPHAELLWKGEKTVIVKSRRFDKYNHTRIYWFDEDYVYGILILGEPYGPLTREEAKALSDKSKITEEEFEKWWPTQKEFWAWKPTILVRFKEPIKHPKWEGIQTFKRQVALAEDRDYGPPYAEVPPSGKVLGEPIKLKDVLNGGFEPIMLQHDFVILTGGVVNQGETTGDVDLVIRAPSIYETLAALDRLTQTIELVPEDDLRALLRELAGEVRKEIMDFADFYDNSFHFRLGRYLQGTRPKLQNRLHIFNDLRGPITSYVPIYSLMLVPLKPLKKVEMSEIELEEEDIAEKIWKLIQSGKWEKLKADERVELMSKQKKITPPLPIVPTKTSKRGYRELEVFEKRSVAKLASEWLEEHPGASIYVEVKFDGMRGLFVKHKNKAWIWTEGGENVADVLPNLSKDLLSLKAETVYLDAEIVPYAEDGRALGRRAVMKALGEKTVNDSRWVAHVFDCIYLNGRQLWKEPYEVRRKVLRGLELPRADVPKHFKFHLQENIPRIATSVEEVIEYTNEVSAVPYSEGAMYKLSDSIYPIGKRTPLWAKYKKFADVDVLVVKRFPKYYKKGPQKGKPIPGQWMIAGAVGPVDPEQLPKDAKIWEPEELTHDGVKKHKQIFVKWEDKIYSLLGLSFATAEKVKPGDIVRVMVRLIRRVSPVEYHWLIPRVFEKRPEKTEPDPLTVVDAIAKRTQYKLEKEEQMSFEEAQEVYEALEDFLFELDPEEFEARVKEFDVAEES